MSENERKQVLNAQKDQKKNQILQALFGSCLTQILRAFSEEVQTGRKAGKCFKGQARRKERNKHSEVKENRCDGFRKSVLLDEKIEYFDTRCFMLPSSYVRVIAFTR